MRTLSTIQGLNYIAICAIWIASPASLHAVESDDRVKIAHRYDEERVVFVVHTQDRLMVPWPDQTSEALPEPQAKLTGLQLFTPSSGRHASAARNLAIAVGDEFALMTGRQNVVTVRVDDIVPANLSCSGAIAAIATVVGQDRERFKALREKYYLLIDRPPQNRSGAVLGLRWGALPPAIARNVNERLNAMLDEQLPLVIASTESTLLREIDAGRRWPLRWQTYNERLRGGEARLTYDAQELWLGAQDGTVLFVRARWLLDGATAFGLSTWISNAGTRVDRIDPSVGRWLRLREFQRRDLGTRYEGLILNIFDYDGDGIGEILHYRRGYEGAQIELLEYSKDGPIPTGVHYAYGC